MTGRLPQPGLRCPNITTRQVNREFRRYYTWVLMVVRLRPLPRHGIVRPVTVRFRMYREPSVRLPGPSSAVYVTDFAGRQQCRRELTAHALPAEMIHLPKLSLTHPSRVGWRAPQAEHQLRIASSTPVAPYIPEWEDAR
jgi:hypothetical protein